MATTRDYYDILGVSKTASADEIKRAFRKHAVKHHPDKEGGDETKFKELNEAYSVLSNPKSREQYDRFGHAGVGAGPQGGAGFGGFEDFDFSGFGFGGGIGDIFGQMFESAMANVQAQVELTIPQAVLGDKVKANFNGQSLDLEIPPGTQDGQGMVFRGKGNKTRSGRHGDLTVIFRVKVPSRLSKEEKELYESLKKLQAEKAKPFWRR